MSLQVIEANGFATIQDAGRKGWRCFGVPASGPMDLVAFLVANRLAGNSDHCAAIEIGLGDMTLQAQQDCVIAVTGLGYQLSIYAWDFPLWSSFYVRAGWTVRLRKVDDGMWAYLAVTGGVQTPPMLGSRSTNLSGHFGGFDGRTLQAGDILKTIPTRFPHEFVPRTIPEGARPLYANASTLHIVMGPQAGNFTKESVETLLSSEYSLTPSSDRMGYRMDGPSLTLRNSNELVSEGMTMGSIQIPANGKPIIMMADCPTTGGYSKIGTVISADLPLLAQCMPNKSRIRFQITTVAKAQKKYCDLINGLNKSIISLKENDAWY